MHDDLLRAALERFGLAPGATWSEILARYRKQAKAWHPDRFKSQSQKEQAEEQLKQIIEAKELLQAHYQGPIHNQNGMCICWGSKAQTTQTQSQTTQSQSQTTQSQSQTTQTQSQTTQSQSQTTPSHNSPPPQYGNKNGDANASGKPAAPKKKNTVWDWRDELCSCLDLGPLIVGEPVWLETFRRMSEKILGKHPGETVMDVWEKPPTWTKEQKRKCLLIAFFAVMIVDKIITAIDPNAFKSPEEISHAQTSQPQKPTLPLSPFPPTRNPHLDPPLDLDSAEEIRQEQRYFDQKWQEREHMQQGIRPGYKPTN